VVLQGGEQDLIVGLEVGAAPGLGDKVDRLGRAPRKDDAGGLAIAQEVSDDASGGLERLGGSFGQGVEAAMDVGRIVAIVGIDGVDHGSRFESGSA
jgi:hypothetical protein